MKSVQSFTEHTGAHIMNRKFELVLATLLGGVLLALPLQAQSATKSSKAMKNSVQPASSATVESWREFKKPADADLKKKLTPVQYSVTQHEGTEVPYTGSTWDNHKAGIYVDVISGEPLFSSADKFDSGTGWPSFTKPLVASNVKTVSDRSLGVERTEVRSRYADSHLGHVFDDGPRPTGLRYCMNSAAMRFIPVDRLKAEGYGEFLKLFNGESNSK